MKSTIIEKQTFLKNGMAWLEVVETNYSVDECRGK